MATTMMTGDKWVMLVLLLVFILALIVACMTVASDADDQMEPVDVSAFYEFPAPEMYTWVRYPIPMSDDLQKYTEEVCREYEFPASVVFAVMEAETGGTFDPELKGDMYEGQYRSFGLMQVMASEHTDRCVRLNAHNLLDAKQNIRVGVDFLAELIAYYDGDYSAALSFYNCDSSGEYAELVLSRAEVLSESAQSVTEVVH